MKDAEVRDVVQSAYGSIAEGLGGCCGSVSQEQAARRLGYSDDDVAGPAAAGNLGLGCGNPGAIAELEEGEVVVDLGSGAGFDALLAAGRVGSEGRVVGVDMTPEMLEKARRNAVELGFSRTVEFREGVIEDVPVASGTADVVISNCVINLSPDKAQVFREAFRVLKPGGRLAVSDIVLDEPLPEGMNELAGTWVACIGGAVTEAAYLGAIRAAGFADVSFERTPAGSMLESFLADPLVVDAIAKIGRGEAKRLAGTVYSYAIRARKP